MILALAGNETGDWTATRESERAAETKTETGHWTLETRGEQPKMEMEMEMETQAKERERAVGE